MLRGRIASLLTTLVLGLLSLPDGYSRTRVLPDPGALVQRKIRDIPNSVLWWNRPHFITGLLLSSNQRARMDEDRSRALEAYGALATRERTAQDGVRDAIWHGDWKAARSRAVDLAPSILEKERLRTEMVINILSELNAFQLQQLATERPRFLNAPWASLPDPPSSSESMDAEASEQASPR